MDINLGLGIIVDANHLKETLLATGGDPAQPLCLLLFGEISGSRVDLQRSLELPLIRSEKEGRLVFSETTLQGRIHLVESVEADSRALGALFITNDLSDIQGIIDELQRSAAGLQWFFTYDTCGARLALKCYRSRGSTEEVPFQLSNSDSVLAAVEALSPSAGKQDDQDEFGEQTAFNSKLLERAEAMIEYMEGGRVSDQALRKMFLLTSLLKKGSTQDIDEALLHKEVELQSLDVICGQWEAAQSIRGFIK
ncbi:LAQU0S01e08768g1_1 [Lachancea quebecensis]|uniref:LAQU0S01e08768g1_1 n=1 Tax=Lachancea quebecensis TaxID=1654605 RepID=A0A0P1KLB7_9SACH|nr:LAQU0S01e08768g1_1 [Lachancea quebecensis]